MTFKYKKVNAIIHPSRMKNVEDALKDSGVHGLTVSEVCGYGEHPNYFDDDWKMPFMRLELFVKAQEADKLAKIIMQAAHTGAEENGIVVILPVEAIYKTKDQQELEAE